MHLTEYICAVISISVSITSALAGVWDSVVASLTAFWEAGRLLQPSSGAPDQQDGALPIRTVIWEMGNVVALLRQFRPSLIQHQPEPVSD